MRSEPVVTEATLERLQGAALSVGQLAVGAVGGIWWLGARVRTTALCNVGRVSGPCAALREAETMALALGALAVLGLATALATEWRRQEVHE